MIDLTTRSGKYRIVEKEQRRAILIWNEDGLNGEFSMRHPEVILELCTELEELRAEQAAKPWP